MPVNIRRVTFNEITKRAVQDAFQHPRDIDRNLVDAQQTRRVLDRLVGYQVSPLLWDKVRRGLSAGRVQTVALRLIVEREREIKAFVKEEYWTIDAHLQAAKPPAFTARFIGIGDEKTPIPNGEEADKLKAALEHADWSVRSIDKRERRRSPAAPFTTSKFQQDASRKLRFSVKRAMILAQRLYEGVDLGDEGTVGLITYMRTDSTRVSNEAVTEVRDVDCQPLTVPSFCPNLRTRTSRRRTRRTRTRPFAPARRFAIPTRSRSICRTTNTRFTSSSGSASWPRR